MRVGQTDKEKHKEFINRMKSQIRHLPSDASHILISTVNENGSVSTNSTLHNADSIMLLAASGYLLQKLHDKAIDPELKDQVKQVVDLFNSLFIQGKVDIANKDQLQ